MSKCDFRRERKRGLQSDSDLQTPQALAHYDRVESRGGVPRPSWHLEAAVACSDLQP